MEILCSPQPECDNLTTKDYISPLGSSPSHFMYRPKSSCNLTRNTTCCLLTLYLNLIIHKVANFILAVILIKLMSHAEDPIKNKQAVKIIEESPT